MQRRVNFMFTGSTYLKGLMAFCLASWLTPVPTLAQTPPSPRRTLEVFADASLRELVLAVEKRFESDHPSIDVRVTLGGSGQLSNQIRAGVNADVFLSAGPRPMFAVSGKFGRPRTFARNALVVVTPLDHNEIRKLPDLAMASQITIANPSDPSYAYFFQVLERGSQAFGRGWSALVQRKVVSEALDVRQVVRGILRGEATVGIAYATDVRVASKVRSVSIVPGLNVPVTYTAAAATRSQYPGSAEAFLEGLVSPATQADLKRRGFLSPMDGVSELPVVSLGGTLRLFVDRAGTMPQARLKVKQGLKTVGYRGIDLRAILGSIPGTRVRFTGADGQSVDVSLTELRKDGAVLVRTSPGNLQVVLPGRPPSLWVKWLRRIEVL